MERPITMFSKRLIAVLMAAVMMMVSGCKKPVPTPPPHKLGDSYPTNLAGDVVGPPQANVVTNLDGKTLPAPSGTNTALIYNGSSLSWGNPVVDGGSGKIGRA